MKFKIIDGKVYVRTKVIERTSVGICPFCGEEVWVSEGQAITYRKKKDRYSGEMILEPTHKICRKKYAR
jgi:hypothetical protein